jgi:hypothetical protein
MAPKIFASLALFFFIFSASATVDDLSSIYAGDSRASFAPGDGDAAPAGSLAVGLNRFARAKSLSKAWISSHSVRPHVGVAWSTIETSLTHPLSKYGVYQQINVYRL